MVPIRNETPSRNIHWDTSNVTSSYANICEVGLLDICI